MGRIRIVGTEDRRPTFGAVPTEDQLSKFERADEHPAGFSYFPVDTEELQLFEVILGPGTRVHPHAHTEDEIIYVTAGSIQLGARTVGPGAAVHIGKLTLYAFEAGPDGCSFLNFRPAASVGYLSKAELLARRQA